MTAPPARVAPVRDDISPPHTEGNGRRPRRGHRAWRIALFAAGVAAIATLLTTVGWSAIAENLGRIGGFFFALVALYGLAQFSFALGWWVLVGRPHPISLPELVRAYLAGDSINYFTGVGGEPVKAHLLRARMGFGRAFATIWVNRNADVLAQWLFLLAGAAIALTHFSLPPVARYLGLVGLILLGGLALGFTGMQRRGFFGPILKNLLRIKPLTARLQHLEEDAHSLDEKIRIYYHREEHRAQFALAVGWGFLGWCGGLLETYLVLRLLSPEHGLPEAVAIEALAMILNSILFFIPAKLGSAEGVRVGVATLVGLTPAQGAAYALVRRARELLWLAPGIVVLLKHHVLDVGHLRLESMSLEDETR